jgi:hypothetical protein
MRLKPRIIGIFIPLTGRLLILWQMDFSAPSGWPICLQRMATIALGSIIGPLQRLVRLLGLNLHL